MPQVENYSGRRIQEDADNYLKRHEQRQVYYGYQEQGLTPPPAISGFPLIWP
jgi:hypothetical protein